jgi:hypothetical protein
LGPPAAVLPTLCWLLLLSGAYPLGLARRANRRTTLFQAVNWSLVAWAGWVCALLPLSEKPAAVTVRYLALGLTGCALMAVLGARRPGVSAWNFVLGGLLAVFLLPVAESLTAGRNLRLDGPRTLFLGLTLAVGILNYLPTRLAPAALLLTLGCAGEIVKVADLENQIGRLERLLPLGPMLLGLAPWVGYVEMGRRALPEAEFDRLWLDFRDRFGLFWGQRLREQFNRSAAHAGWPVYLRWQGLRLTGGPRPDLSAQTAMVAALRALLKRFGSNGSVES